mmetsp:Transcript_9187/g.22459  ORF Transcript_9187/g.22459 Transcript_9187/m.22459 type:complete len:125 (-) Transcript_9187:1158-1532(-)
MKFASIAVALTLATQTVAFAPSAGISNSRVAQTTNGVLDNIVAVGPVSTSARNTELNLFGFGKKRKFNEPAKVDGDITEGEVRGLFELWNDALATGDSAIVASRYTKVSVLVVRPFSRWAFLDW